MKKLLLENTITCVYCETLKIYEYKMRPNTIPNPWKNYADKCGIMFCRVAVLNKLVYFESSIKCHWRRKTAWVTTYRYACEWQRGKLSKSHLFL